MGSLPSHLAGLAVSAVFLCAAAAAWGTGTAPEAAPSTIDDTQGVIVTAVRPNIWMLTVGGKNLALQTGEDGAVVVDTGPPGTGAAVLRAIQKLTTAPIRYVIDTSADEDVVGNNAAVAAAGHMLGGPVGRAGLVSAEPDAAAPIIAYQSVLTRMARSPPRGRPYSTTALPEGAFDSAQGEIFLSGQAIRIIWQPAAHSDGDSIVQFQRDDVLVTGAVFDMTRFPVIDVAAGGSIQGEIAAINRLLDRYVTAVTPLAWQQGDQYGTLIIPARGHLSDQSDLVQYRDMLTIIRDRIAHYISQGKSMQQVVALKPAAGYEPRFGARDGSWTTDEFVQAVYQSLKHGDGKRTDQGSGQDVDSAE